MASKVKFATYFDRESWIKDNGTVNTMESLTDQSFRDMSDVNYLLLNYRGTPRTPVYDMNNYETADWTFEDWQNEKARIERKYLHLTPEMKAMFKSPQEFFAYCSNPDNYEMTETGIQEKPQQVFTQPDQNGQVTEVIESMKETK